MSTLPSNEDLIAEFQAAAWKWLLEKNNYTLESLRDARKALLSRMNAPETSEPQPCPIPEANGFSIQGKEIGPGIWGIGNVSWHPESGDWRGMADINGALCVVTLKVTAQKASETRPATAGASLIVSAEQAKDLLAFRHWSKDFLVPYVGCHCSTCVAASSSERGRMPYPPARLL